MIHETLLTLAWLAPLLLAATVIVAPRLAWRAMAMAGLPGLAAAIMVPVGSTIEFSSLLLGTRFGLDEVGRGFLFFTGTIWVLAGWHAFGYISERRNSFAFFFLLAMSGNFGLVLAHDMLGFYVFFALMSFASYGLVIHERTTQVRHAAKVYMVLVVVGEVLIFSGMVGVANLTGTTSLSEIGAAWVEDQWGALFIGLLLLGFGIKAGALPLHVWLPLAHPAAPTPASAVLSGAMIKAGLLGWLRFLPIGEATLPEWGAICAGLGGVTFLGAAIYGCLQSNPKTLLAYSSISKMGLLTIAVGVVLAKPDSAGVMIPAILVFATHHCLCKGALFISVSIHHRDVKAGPLRWLTILLLLLPPLSLTGFTLTGGAAAKAVMKTGLSASVSSATYTGLTTLMLINTLITAALMFRFYWLRFTLSPQSQKPPTRISYCAWGTLVGLVIISPLLFSLLYPGVAFEKSFSASALWGGFWPVMIIGIIGALITRRSWLFAPHLPAGDILVLYTSLIRQLARLATVMARLPRQVITDQLRAWIAWPHSKQSLSNFLSDAELRLRRAAVFGLVFISLITLSTFLLLLQI